MVMDYSKETYMKKQLTPQHELRTTNRRGRNAIFSLFVFLSFVEAPYTTLRCATRTDRRTTKKNKLQNNYTHLLYCVLY